CTKCGAKIIGQPRFCSKCGNKLAGPELTSESKSASPVSETSQVQTAASAPKTTPPPVQKMVSDSEARVEPMTESGSMASESSQVQPTKTEKKETNSPSLEELQMLGEYKKLLDIGAITQEEFDERKRQILR
ncbi:MAG: SHOCT domain-containing protein, partial [Eubacterium sp.]|nr:SHOCT domain-containing protein [Eubacterium sp.]